MTANLVCVYWNGFTLARALHIKLDVTATDDRAMLELPLLH
jgi:hypothetical protein